MSKAQTLSNTAADTFISRDDVTVIEWAYGLDASRFLRRDR